MPACRKAQANVRTVRTSIESASCARETDPGDPNDTPYLKCPGTAGYTLLVRKVGSGQTSIEVVDPAQRTHPLHYEEFITRQMFALEKTAEWRIEERGDTPRPIALIVRVAAHEDEDDPAKVTRRYLAVSKITDTGACVTDRIVEGAQPDDGVRKIADTARERPCAQPLGNASPTIR